MQEPAYRILISSLAATIRQPAGLLIEKTEIAPRAPSISESPDRLIDTESPVQSLAMPRLLEEANHMRPTIYLPSGIARLLVPLAAQQGTPLPVLVAAGRCRRVDKSVLGS
jgi:hypothetical protein